MPTSGVMSLRESPTRTLLIVGVYLSTVGRSIIEVSPEFCCLFSYSHRETFVFHYYLGALDSERTANHSIGSLGSYHDLSRVVCGVREPTVT